MSLNKYILVVGFYNMGLYFGFIILVYILGLYFGFIILVYNFA